MNAGSFQIRILAAESRRQLFIDDRRMIRTAMLCGSLLYLLLSAVPIQALDPNLRLTQYMHKSWANPRWHPAGCDVFNHANLRWFSVVLSPIPRYLQI